MKKLLIRIGAALVVAALLLYIGRNWILRKGAEIAVRHATGFTLTIGTVDFSLFSGALTLAHVRLQNPPDFPDRAFVELPELRIDYHALSFLRRRPHIRELVVNVSEVTLVKNADGESNASRLQAKLGSGKSADQIQTPYRVDKLQLHIGTVIIKDYSKGSTPTVRTLRLNQDLVVRDLTESTSITAIVLRQVLGPVGTVAGELVQGAGAAVQKAGKGLVDTLKKVVPPASNRP